MIEQHRQLESVEFEKIEASLELASKTLKHDLKAVRILNKARTNKFVLPLSIAKKDDLKSFNQLVNQPLNFLVYNDAMFSVDLKTGLYQTWNGTSDSSVWIDLVDERKKLFDEVFKRVEQKQTEYISRQIKLNKVYNKLEKHIGVLKLKFEKKAIQYKNSKYLHFIAGRIKINILKIRAAEKMIKRKIKILNNKQLNANPQAFFERALRLYLCETGIDIRKDLDILGYNKTRTDAELGITYLYFLMHLIEKKDDKFKSPVLPIFNSVDFVMGYEKVEILKVLAGHMFVHTVSIFKENVKQEVELEPNL